jgi:hypothetical protein
MGIAEFIVGPAEGQTRWLHPAPATAPQDAFTSRFRHQQAISCAFAVTGLLSSQCEKREICLARGVAHTNA